MRDHHEPVVPIGDGGLVRIRLNIGYDGTAFSGWAVQPGRRTVQGVLQDALATVSRTSVALTIAGRTDAGVHATGQVAHADVPTETDLTGLVRLLRGVLTPDVRVHAVTAVPACFDARFSALWRRYEYRMSDAATGVEPLRRAFVVDWRRPLDVEAMSHAALGLTGEHEFAAFCRHRDGGTTIRVLQSLEVGRVADEIVVTVQADAFCHSMVRSLVGALAAVGEGRRDVAWPTSLLGRKTRADDVSVVPAHGLTLVAVGYPPDDQLAARATQTRRLRAAPAQAVRPTPTAPRLD
ncbi:MAG: tRNA pseudouridine(38-40) synthase TruA [Actinomycetota bacterium]